MGVTESEHSPVDDHTNPNCGAGGREASITNLAVRSPMLTAATMIANLVVVTNAKWIELCHPEVR